MEFCFSALESQKINIVKPSKKPSAFAWNVLESGEEMRNFVQMAWLALTNGYVYGFFQGKIYQGKGKMACLPGLNCYSCPGALGACPLGAFQASLTSAEKSIPFYALGFLIFFGTMLGRGVCGFLCPFGFVQDLLDKIPLKKVHLPKFLDKLRLNYLVLLLFVVIMPLTLTNQFNMSAPAFCKWICPSGTLFGGIPLLSMNESLRGNVSWLFSWKLCLLLGILMLSTLVYRPFCRYLCPLGAFYGLYNKISLYKLELDKQACTGCKSCHRACKLEIPVTESLNSAGCIRCGDCVKACPQDCLHLPGFQRNTDCNTVCENYRK